MWGILTDIVVFIYYIAYIAKLPNIRLVIILGQEVFLNHAFAYSKNLRHQRKRRPYSSAITSQSVLLDYIIKQQNSTSMVMYLGQCVEYANTKQFFNNPMHPYSKALLSAIPEPTFEAIGKQFDILHGEVKSPISPPPGCRFAPRCAYAGDGQPQIMYTGEELGFQPQADESTVCGAGGR